MLTYQDLLSVGEIDHDRADFCRSVVNSHIGSAEYNTALIADEYYHKHEPTIEKAMKFYYTATGRQEEDIFAANYKLKFLFFRKKITQHVAYILNNGIVMDENTKLKLDKHLEKKAKQWTKYAMVAGRSYVFYNNGSVEVFHMVCNDYHPGFAPLYDENTAQLAAGVRFFYRRATNRNLITMTLYESDGYTEFREDESGEYTISDKMPYLSVKTTLAATETVSGRNYGRLPIVEAVANDCRESELVGLREDIDAYEFVKSDLCNELADFTGLWYSIEGAGGMTDQDVAKFIQRLKTIHAAIVDGDGSGGTKVTANTQTIPYDARAKMLEILRADLHENAHLVDMKSLSAAQKTTQEIQSMYNDQDNYCGDLRDNVVDVIDQLMEIAGLPETDVRLQFDKVVNVTETTSAVMMMLPLIGDDAAIDLLPMLTADQKDAVKKARLAEQIARITRLPKQDDEEDTEPDEEEEAEAE